MVTRMDALFLIDRDARQRELNPQERLRHRNEYAEEWLRGIHDSCLLLALEALPKSALGQAVTYTLNMWEKLGAVSTTRKWSCPTTWRKTPCVGSRWDARTGCTWAAHRRVRKSRRFFRRWNPAAGWGASEGTSRRGVAGIGNTQAYRRKGSSATWKDKRSPAPGRLFPPRWKGAWENSRSRSRA
jgi:hypothetical protein